MLANVLVDTAGRCTDLRVARVTDLRLQTSATSGVCADFTDGGSGSVARMRIDTAGADGIWTFGHTTEDVVIEVAGAGAGAIVWDGVHRRWQVSAGQYGAILAQSTAESTLTDALVRASGAAVYAARGPATLRNVTAVGGTAGLLANGSDGTSPAAAITGVNVIARGASPAADIVAGLPNGCHPAFCPPAPGRIALSHSNVRTTPTPNLVFGAGMQAADPLFVSATDLHLKAGSPAQHAGTSAVDSATDVDGDARAQGAAIDIGGDEVPAAPVSPPPPPPGTGADTTAPTVQLGATRKRIVVTSSEAATLRVVVRRATEGRKKRGACRPKTQAQPRAQALHALGGQAPLLP